MLDPHQQAVPTAGRGRAPPPANPSAGGSLGDEEGDVDDVGDQHMDEDDDDDESGDEESYKLGKNFVYDWKAYHNAFGDKPWDEAVTGMFCEYAELYARISGHIGATVPTPMTLSKAKSIDEQAANFITKHVTPILGRIFSTKFHKLLRHVLDAVRHHGNLRNGNTSANEGYHKADKAFYGRTNKDFETFTHQLVRHAQGSREIIAQHLRTRECPAEDEPSGAASGEGASSEAAGVSSTAAAEGGSSSGVPAPALSSSGVDAYVPASCAPLPGPCARRRSTQVAPRADGGRGKRTDYLHTKSVGEICELPGMATAGEALGLPHEAQVSVLSRLSFTARLDCGGLRQQLLYAHTWFRGGPWFDAVVYYLGGNTEDAFIGEVRTMVRYPDQDVALIREWEPVEPVPGCPFHARGCRRLKWLMHAGDTNISVREVPIANVRRLAHVVPDFGDLLRRRGIEAVPPASGAPLYDELEMRFFVNAFLPWA